MKQDAGRMWRYALWAALLEAVYAVRKATHLRTAWIFHLTGNTLLLLLPEISRALSTALDLDARGSGVSAASGVLREVVSDNPEYLSYITPVVTAYLFSHPKCNIYKSDWANRQLLGFGLDSIPHALTALALTKMVVDGVAALRRNRPAGRRMAAPLEWAAAHPVALSAGVLAAATAAYEGGEYAIHRAEMEAVHHDRRKLAMEWSVADTVQDVISNAAGWLAGLVLLRATRRRT